jgi:hypothetical protein
MKNIFQIGIYYRGHHRKGMTIHNAFEVKLEHKTVYFNKQKHFFEHCRKSKTINNL